MNHTRCFQSHELACRSLSLGEPQLLFLHGWSSSLHISSPRKPVQQQTQPPPYLSRTTCEVLLSVNSCGTDTPDSWNHEVFRDVGMRCIGASVTAALAWCWLNAPLAPAAIVVLSPLQRATSEPIGCVPKDLDETVLVHHSPRTAPCSSPYLH